MAGDVIFYLILKLFVLKNPTYLYYIINNRASNIISRCKACIFYGGGVKEDTVSLSAQVRQMWEGGFLAWDFLQPLQSQQILYGDEPRRFICGVCRTNWLALLLPRVPQTRLGAYVHAQPGSGFSGSGLAPSPF